MDKLSQAFELGFIKGAKLEGMSFDPNNPMVQQLQEQYGDDWKQKAWEMQGGTGTPNIQDVNLGDMGPALAAQQ